jgi:hypothetical protein
MECQVEKNEHFRHLLRYEFSRGSKAAEAARNICAVYGEDYCWKNSPKNGLRTSSKAVLTRVTLRSSQDSVVHLVGYRGDYPL